MVDPSFVACCESVDDLDEGSLDGRSIVQVRVVLGDRAEEVAAVAEIENHVDMLGVGDDLVERHD